MFGKHGITIYSKKRQRKYKKYCSKQKYSLGMVEVMEVGIQISDSNVVFKSLKVPRSCYVNEA